VVVGRMEARWSTGYVHELLLFSAGGLVFWNLDYLTNQQVRVVQCGKGGFAVVLKLQFGKKRVDRQKCKGA
jgi:hypothetical protein